MAANWWDADEVVAPAPAQAQTASPAPAAPANWWDQDEVVQAAPAAAPARRSWMDVLRGLGESSEAVAPMPTSLPTPVQASNMPYSESVGHALEAIASGVYRGSRMFADGASLGTFRKPLAGIKTGFGFLGDYQQELAGQRAYDAETETAAPIPSALLKGAGNIASMAALQGVGVPVFGAAGAGLMARTGQALIANSALGFGAGAVNEDDNRKKVLSGLGDAAFHGGVGAAGPIAGAALGTVFGFGSRQLAGRFNPDAYAAQRVGRALRDSGRTVDDVADAITVTNAEGAPFMAADAMGHSGRRSLAAVAKSPGPGREAIVEALEQRQAGQARRVQNALIEGLDAPQTAAATEQALTASRNTAADAAYGAARAQAGAVDVTPALMRIDQTLAPGAAGQLGVTSALRDDTIESALRQARAMLSNGQEQLTGFEAVARARAQIRDAAEAAQRGGRGNQARLLGEVARDLGDGLAAASQPYAAARDAYAAGSRRIEAVGRGREAAQRGRTEDTIPAFQALTPEEQAAYRAGYADPYVASVQGAPVGTNVARPLTSEAVRAEFPVIAAPQRGPLMMRRIDYENEMFRTRQGATGGSSTAENLADMAAQRGIDPGALADALSFNIPGLARRATSRIAHVLEGASEQSLDAAGRLLMTRDPNTLRAALQAQAAAQARRDAMVAALARGGVGYGLSTYRSLGD